MLNSNDKSISFLFRALFLIFFSLALISCSGGGGGDDSSSDDDNSSGDDSSSGGAAGVDPIATLGSPVTLAGFTIESGSEGDIEFVNQEFQLSTPSMHVADVQRVFAVDLSCINGDDVNGVITSNFSTGVVGFDAVINGQSESCTSNFQPKFPPSVTIATVQDIADLLLEWGTDFLGDEAAQSGFISTNCPSSVDADIDTSTNSCDGSFLANYTVTDDQGGIHKLSTKFTYTSSTGGGAGGNVTFSGAGVSDLPGTGFTSITVQDTGDTVVWTDSNFTIITMELVPGTFNVVSVSVIATNGGVLWAESNPAGISVTATEVTFNNVSVTNLTPTSQPIVLDGSLNR